MSDILGMMVDFLASIVNSPVEPMMSAAGRPCSRCGTNEAHATVREMRGGYRYGLVIATAPFKVSASGPGAPTGSTTRRAPGAFTDVRCLRGEDDSVCRTYVLD